MSKLLFPMVLQLLGIVIILVEFVVPSMGLLTISAIGVFGYSLYLIFVATSFKTSVIVAGFDMALIPVLIWIGVKIIARSPLALRTAVSDTVTDSSPGSSTGDLVGKEGTTLTKLVPAGKALIEGKRLDVVSSGDYIEQNEEIVVTVVEGNRIVVKCK